MSLLTVGTVAFDEIITPLGESGKVVGGAANYISLSASYFVPKSYMVSVIGDDFPQEHLDLFKAKGIKTDGLQIKNGEKSFYWKGKYHNDMNSRDTLVTDLNVLETFEPIIPESYQDAEYIMLGNLSPQVQMSVLNQLKSKPKLVVLDTMNFWMDIAMEPLKEVIAKVDVLTINDEEARQLSGKYSLASAAQEILTMGPRYLIIKKGEHGALLFDKENMFFAPAMPLNVVFDPTGAGDTFAGGFIGHIAKTNDTSFENLKRAIIYGSALASFCVEKFGTVSLHNLSEQDIENRVDKFRKLIAVDI